MAVVINEFEVVPGASPPAQNSSSSSGQNEASTPPPDIEQMLDHERERCERVWAH